MKSLESLTAAALVIFAAPYSVTAYAHVKFTAEKADCATVVTALNAVK